MGLFVVVVVWLVLFQFLKKAPAISFFFYYLLFKSTNIKNVDCTHYVVQTERVRIVFDVEEPFWGICGSLGSFMIWKETRELG